LHTRIISGVLGAMFVLAVLAFNTHFVLLINILLSIISVLSVSEIFNAMGISKVKTVTVPTFVFAGVIPLFDISIVGQICWYVYTVVMFLVMILNKSLKLKDISLVNMTAVVIAFSISRIVALRNYGGEYGSFYVLLTLAVAWLSDTGAYFFGKYFGKNKLCPNVSPKKTFEGFFGGVLVCTLSVMLIGFIFNNFIFTEKHNINYFMLFILGLTGSPISAL
jgi:phosphatidate cytidylyltransferase